MSEKQMMLPAPSTGPGGWETPKAVSVGVGIFSSDLPEKLLSDIRRLLHQGDDDLLQV